MKGLNHTFWKKYFAVYDILNRVIPYQELVKEFHLLLELKNGDRILDVGAGTCNFSCGLVKNGVEVYALDNIVVGLDICKIKKSQIYIVNHNLVEKMPFKDEFFDRIISNNAIYLVDPKMRSSIFSDFYRLLKPGGKIIVSNIRASFKPTEIYKMHFKKSVDKSGFLRTIIDAVKFMVPTIRMLYYNSIITRSDKSGSFKFFEEGEQKRLLEKSGFIKISEERYTYANQAIINTALK